MTDRAPSCNESPDSTLRLTLRRQVEARLNSRLQPMSFRLLMSLPETYRSFRIVNGELGFTVSLLDRDQHLQAELQAALATLEKEYRLLPAIGLAEKLALRARNLAWRVIESTSPLPVVRVCLKVLASAQTVLSLQVPDAHSYNQIKVGALCDVMQEPQQEITRYVHQHQFYLYWNYTLRLRHLRQANSNNAQVADIDWSERAEYAAMSSACKDSRVLVTIHMGDFFGAFRCIADELQEPRPVMSLRREGETEGIKNLHQRIANHHQVFMHGKDNPVRIVKALRAGGQTLSVMFDLGGDFGETTDVMFFGHPARFVRGPAEMAILGRARIYPFVCFEDAGQARIRMEPSFMPAMCAGESLHDAVNRVTQTLVSLAERWIRQHPAQWKYLDRLPHYLILDEPQPGDDSADGDQQHQHQQQRGAFDA
jgi:lauroyl/myristoyl acyltransferase